MGIHCTEISFVFLGKFIFFVWFEEAYSFFLLDVKPYNSSMKCRLGSKVAMFVYSSVKIYAACKPPPVLEFHDPKGQEWFKKEMEDVSTFF